MLGPGLIPPLFDYKITDEDRQLACDETRADLAVVIKLMTGMNIPMECLNAVLFAYERHLGQVTNDAAMKRSRERSHKQRAIADKRIARSPHLRDEFRPLVPPELEELQEMTDEQLDAEYERLVTNAPKSVD